MQPGTQLAQYRIIRRIGAGGMAEVFLAQRIGRRGLRAHRSPSRRSSPSGA
jgi:serine/threonine protein kinase